MRVTIKPKTLIMFALLVLATSCHASSCDRWGNAPRTEYYFQGGEVSFAEGTTSQVEVLDFTRGLLNNESYYMNLWRVDADDSDEEYKLKLPRYVTNRSQFGAQDGLMPPPEGDSIDGMLEYDGISLHFDLQVTTADSVFSNLRLTGTTSYDDLQRLVKQVRLPAWSNNTSDESAEVDWTLTGDYEGSSFSVNFTQVFHGKSRYPVYPSWL